MENSILVSVIVSVFNVKPYIVEALDSIICQTYNTLDVVLVDDGSTDGSGVICDEYADKDGRITVIHQNNHGLSAARNAGLEIMKGDYVSFLDPDDAFCPDYVETMLETAIRENAEIVACRYSAHRTAGKMDRSNCNWIVPSIAENNVYDRPKALRALAEGSITHAVWNKLYKRHLWDGMRFPEGRVYEDIGITYRIIDKCESACVLDRILYMHRLRTGSIANTISRKNIMDWNLSRSQFDAFVEANTPEIFTFKQLQKVRRSRLNRKIARFARYSLKAGEKDTEFSKELREEILKMCTKSEIKTFGFCTRAAYSMTKGCPRLVQIVYPVYKSARLFAYKVNTKKHYLFRQQ